MKVTNKALILTICLTLIVGGIIGGTIAWLTDQTDEVVNTFTVGNIDIALTEDALDENEGGFKMVPGNAITKDPIVTVSDGSEDCWLFVKIEGSSSLASYITYEIASGWTALDGVGGVYYRQVAANAAAREFPVLQGNKVTVKTDVTKEMMDALEAQGAARPTLSFTAYAVQQANIPTVAGAWSIVSPTP